MRTPLLISIVAAVSLVAGAGGTLLWKYVAHPANATHEPDEASAQTESGLSKQAKEEPAAYPVRVAKVMKGSITGHIAALGTVQFDAAASSLLNWPTDLMIRQVFVVPGQNVKKNQPLLRVAPTADTAMQLELARKDLEASEAALRSAEGRLEMQLATQQEVAAARAAATQARLRLDRLAATSLPEDEQIRASADGAVLTVAVSPGSFAPANSPLLNIADEKRLVAELGVEPVQAALLRGHEHAELALTGELRPVTGGVVTLVQPTIDPLDRLRKVRITGDALKDLAIGTPVHATIELAPITDALLVPRSALLPTSEGTFVFVISDGKAIRRKVQCAEQENGVVRVVSGLNESDEVAIQGQGDLVDGSLVHIVAAPEGDR